MASNSSICKYVEIKRYNVIVGIGMCVCVCPELDEEKWPEITVNIKIGLSLSLRIFVSDSAGACIMDTTHGAYSKHWRWQSSLNAGEWEHQGYSWIPLRSLIIHWHCINVFYGISNGTNAAIKWTAFFLRSPGMSTCEDDAMRTTVQRRVYSSRRRGQIHNWYNIMDRHWR